MLRLTDKERLEAEEKGLKEGLKEGKKETARNMLKKEFSIKDISEITGLSEEEIKNLSPKQ